MALGLVGKKIGMSREFLDSGTSVPVTVVRVEKGRVIDVYSKEKNGYSAVKLGFLKIKQQSFLLVRWASLFDCWPLQLERNRLRDPLSGLLKTGPLLFQH